MAQINHEAQQVRFRIVYVGPPLSGKTANLQYIHSRLDVGEDAPDLMSMASAVDRTLFIDYLPIPPSLIMGWKTHFGLYTSPGIENPAVNEVILNNIDGLIFVADSRPENRDANVTKRDEVRRILKSVEISEEDHLSIAVQLNHRDAPNATPVDQMPELFPGAKVFQTVAHHGYNVFATLNHVGQDIVKRFHEHLAKPA